GRDGRGPSAPARAPRFPRRRGAGALRPAHPQLHVIYETYGGMSSGDSVGVGASTGGASTGGAADASGSVTRKVAPFPGAVCTATVPPWAWTMAATMASPSPAPP